MVRLIDVAEKARVSISTVSKVLNNAEVQVAISEKTRDRVQRAARELGYLPNAAARALRRQQFRTLGVVGSSPQFFRIKPETRSFNSEAMCGLMEGAVKRGYHVILLSGMETEPEAGGAFADIGMADALLVLNRDLQTDDTYLATLHNSGKPVMYVLDYPADPEALASAPDDEQGGRLATRSLLDAGCRRIALVRKTYYRGIFDRRQKGWEQALQQAGMAAGPELVMDVDAMDTARVRELGIDGMVCLNDQITKQLAPRLKTAGVRVPGDIRLISFVHEASVTDLDTPCAAVVEPLARIVEDAVHRLVDLLEGKPIEERQRLFPYTYGKGS
ncbi:MAG: LacI family DNA-binding transcriptional regulator [Kiritimatiellae bacterium]|nr:LacI family DNA-binding transcriptional regulator [Kiritimatiellia bacterium]